MTVNKANIETVKLELELSRVDGSERGLEGFEGLLKSGVFGEI
jgi:hypothetical protein